MSMSLKMVFALAVGALLSGAVLPAAAQTKSARGINMSSSSIGAVVPELGNLESEILETVTLMEEIENCGQDSRFYDPVSESCRTTDPVNVEFEQDADNTTVEVQNPDGTSVEYALDGADGVATNGEGEPLDPEDPDDPDEPEVGGEPIRYVCSRNGTTWDVGGIAYISGSRQGTRIYYCCEGVPQAEAGQMAGISVLRDASERQYCP